MELSLNVGNRVSTVGRRTGLAHWSEVMLSMGN